MQMGVDSRILITKYKKNMKVILPKAIKDNQQDYCQPKTVYFDSEDRYIKRILTNHGWTIAKNDKHCQLKWVYTFKHNAFSQLTKHTKINHFPHSYTLTTKLGLCKTLKSQRGAIIGDLGTSYSNFYPRSYDLSEENDIFIKDFRQTAIINLLKKVMIAIEIEDQSLFAQLHGQTLFKNRRKRQTNWVKQLEELYQKSEVFEKIPKGQSGFIINSNIFQSLMWYLSVMFTLDSVASEDHFDQRELLHLTNYSQLNPPYRSLQEHYGGDKTLAKSPTINALRIFFGLYQEALQRFSWFRADGLRNVWVVKANDSSRGRNIVLISSLQQLKLLNSGTRLVQKYVQDVWVYRQDALEIDQRYPFMHKIFCKKFDIRIWVFVRSFAPLQVYIYQQGYLRISKEQYQLLNLNSNSTHLTNFSVNWKHKKGDSQNSYILLSDFKEYLHQEGIKNKTTLSKQIHQLILQTLQAAEMSVVSSDQRCFELYGFDIILDSQLKPWLLEVNMSPACKERGKLVQELQKMGSGLLSLAGLINQSIYQSKWIPLTSKDIFMKKHSKKKENSSPFTHSDNLIRVQSTKFTSIGSKEQEQLQLSRANSIFPIISTGMSGHIKNEGTSGNMVNKQTLVVLGTGLYGKTFKKYDRFVNYLSAVKIIEDLHPKVFKKQQRKSIMPTQDIPLTFLRLYECLIVMAMKVKTRAFKRLKKLLIKKKSMKIRHAYSIR